MFNHYAGLVHQGSIVRWDEDQAFRLVCEALPAYGAYAVLRAGLGELAFLLNGAGLDVAACEPNAGRLNALGAGLAHLLAGNLVTNDRFAIVPDFVPDRVNARPFLGVATDFVFELPLEQDQAFCRKLQLFDGLLINPRLFVRLRETPQEQDEVATYLRSLGFSEVARFPREQMIYFARSSGAGHPAPEGPAPEGQASPGGAGGASDFDRLAARLVALAPPVPAPTPGTTWIERRVSKFDLRSALGDDE
ncbi:hypothetical protein [Reyranella sp.]|uniref:hypothetical protein n=1 Tax=Reyranella sp. TaxID=1929291 RepID=UPI003BAA1DD7